MKECSELLAVREIASTYRTNKGQTQTNISSYNHIIDIIMKINWRVVDAGWGTTQLACGI